mmetsp:Transcript_1586/g.6943  ORF Transcript_1586/g.6943 Transcript_1586/m.6943 type:complete len:335 (+) Transcript_1586:273-1277(+)
MRLLGPMLIIGGSALILSAAGLYVTLVLPSIAPRGTLLGELHLFWSFYLLFNIFFNYILCASTRPGRPARLRTMPGLPDEETGQMVPAHPHSAHGGRAKGGRLKTRVKVPSPGRALLADGVAGTNAAVPERFVVMWRYCETCRNPKPPRTHHCSVCNECVLNMDHHCPWMNNCIGYYNYRYFFLFLMYLWISCVYLMTSTFKPYEEIYRREGQEALTVRLVPTKRNAVVFCFVIALSVTFAISILWGWHIYLLLSGQSTIEFYLNRRRRAYARSRGRIWRNPFDLGIQKNWEQVFGPGNPLLAVQPSFRDPPEPISPFCPASCGPDLESEARIV